METALVIVSAILAIILVNAGQRLLMKIMGADTMFFSVRGKLTIIIIATLLICGLLGNLFGIG